MDKIKEVRKEDKKTHGKRINDLTICLLNVLYIRALKLI